MSRHTRKLVKGGNRSDHIHTSSKMIMGPITDPSYKHIGIIHCSQIAGINVLRQLGTDWANFFGGKGFDEAVYDYCRKRILNKLEDLLHKDQIVADLKFDMETREGTITLHAHGTLYEKSSKSSETE